MAPLPSFLRDLEKEYRRRWSQPTSWWNLLVLCPVVLVLIWFFYSLHSRSQVAIRQQITIGVIETHDPSNHDRYGYRFSVSNKRFTGWAYPGSYRDFYMGETIAVYYDPRDPNTNSPYDFHETNPGGFLIVTWCMLAGVGVPLSIYLQRRATKRAGGNTNFGR